jgi:hypothetical protein
MKRLPPVLFATCGLGIAIALFAILPQPRLNPEPAARPSGAMAALDWWAAARAYPSRAIPDVGHAAAYLAAERTPLRAAGLDEAVSPWTGLGPENIGGRTLALALHPDDHDVIFAGSASGGLWKSTSGGVGASAWEYVETGHPVLAVSTIAIDDANADVMYVGTGEVYRYQDASGGEVIRTTRGSYGIGILKSTDAGVTWALSLDWTLAQTRGIWAVRIHPADSDILFAATTEGVFRSRDAGGTWSLVLDVIMAMDVRVHPSSPDTVLAACGNFSSPGHGLYRSTDGGDSWTKITSGLPTGFSGKAQLAFAPSSPDVVYATFADSFASRGLRKSTNAGLTWTLVNSADFASYQGWYSHYVAVSPFDAERLYVGGIEIWRSVNGGVGLVRRSDWTQVYLGTPPPGGPGGGPQYAHADHHAAVPHPTNADVFFFASDGGVFKTTDGGDTFLGLNGGYVSTQFYNGFACAPAASDLALGGMQDNFTAIYEGTSAWRRVIGGDGCWTAIHPSNPDVMYGSYQYLNILRSSNAGADWSNIAPPELGDDNTAFVAPYVLSPADPDILYAGRSRIYKSTNEGQSWFATGGGDPVDNGNPVLCLAISPTHPDTVFAGTAPLYSPARILRTTNGGISWLNITGTLPDRYPADLTVDPADSRTVYVVFSGFGTSHVFRSTNGGLAWTDIGASLPDVPTSAIVVDPDYPEVLYAGMDLGVYVSTNSGATWEVFAAGMPTALVNDLKIFAPARSLRAATHGSGAFERDLVNPALVGVHQIATGAESSGSLQLTVAPHPLRSDSRVSFELARPTRVQLELFDVRGRRIRTLLDEVRGPGRHAVGLAADQLVPGVYFLRLDTGGEICARRLVRTS